MNKEILSLPEFQTPAEALHYFLNKKAITAYALSKETQLQQSGISEILNGKRRLSTETATILGSYFETGTTFWLSLQSKYDIYKSESASAIHIDFQGELSLGGYRVQCYVLPDERRVISAPHLFMLFGITDINVGFSRFVELLNSPFLQSKKMDALRRTIKHPLKIKDSRRLTTYGYEGTIVVDFCDALLDVRSVGGIPNWAAEYVQKAEVVMRSIAKVGIIALIDEATGFQTRRNKDALEKLLDSFFKEEYAAWSKRFPDWFYEEMFRLKSWQWASIKGPKPPYVGKLTKDIVYSRLEHGVISELERKNPLMSNGYRKVKHHQWLSDEVGHPALDAHFYALRGLMRSQNNWERFYHVLQLAFPKKNESVQLELADYSPAIDI